MSVQQETDAIFAIQGAIRQAVNAGIGHDEIALQVQEGFADIGIQAVCKINVIGAMPNQQRTAKKKPKPPRP